MVIVVCAIALCFMLRRAARITWEVFRTLGMAKKEHWFGRHEFHLEPPKDITRLWQLVKIPVVLTRAWWATKDRTHIPRRGIPVGARVAIREAKSDAWENARPDEITIRDHIKIIEWRILKATEDFLKAHDVDTSIFEERATNIINSGVLTMCGRTNVNQSPVGPNANVVHTPEKEEQSA